MHLQMYSDEPGGVNMSMVILIVKTSMIHTLWHKTYAVFAVVLLTGTGLRVEFDHRGQLAVLAGKAYRTVTPVIVNLVHTRPTVLAHIVGTVVLIVCAVHTNEAILTHALVVCLMVDT